MLAYLRCSTVDQANDGTSLDVQEARIRAWADAVGYQVAEVVADAGVSGTKLLRDREGGRRVDALLDARKPDVDVIAVLRLDRLGRDAAERLALVKRFQRSRVGLFAVAEHVDLATPHGRAMVGVSAVFAELERAMIAERTAESLRELRREGKPWNHPPFGWRVVGAKDAAKRIDTRRLVPVAREQRALTRMRELRAAGLSYAKVAETLSAEGHQTKRGGKWAAMTVRETLRAQPDAA